MCLQFNSLRNDGLVLLGPLIETFKGLTALDLSQNNIDISGTHPVAETSTNILAKMLSELPNLTRLDLGNNRLKNKLKHILAQMPQGLTYLKLCGCGVSNLDLSYLIRSHHAASLRELDLSANNFADKLESVIELLKALHSTLEVLELEEIELVEEDFDELFRFASANLQQLYFWNLSRNHNLTERHLTEGIRIIARMKCLKVFKVSHPVECYVSIEPDEVDEEKMLFSERATSLVNRECDMLGRHPFELCFMH